MSYPLFVASRKKSGEEILKSLNGRKASAAHMLVGLLGRFLAYQNAKNREESREELGGMCFYLTGLAQDMSLTPLKPRPYSVGECMTPLPVHLEALVGEVKRVVFRNKPQDDEKLEILFDSMTTAIAMQAHSLDTTLTWLLSENRAKLEEVL